MSQTQATKNILIVDDDLYLCEIIADVLEAEGHATRTASNGLEALERVREEKPDLLLLDLMMPVMSGWELAAAIRSSPEWSNIPMIIITADYHIERKQEETGARAVITKPFDIDQLVSVVAAQ
jgi:two-component system chemotaxis response regulator CheY